MLNLDTHILIWALTGDLRPRERAALSAAPWGISAIVLWELAMLARLGRIEFDLESSALSSLLSRIHSMTLYQEAALRFADSSYTTRAFDFYRAVVGYTWTTRRGTFVTLAPSPGTVLIWESWMRHEVLASAARSARISVSFNYGWR